MPTPDKKTSAPENKPGKIKDLPPKQVKDDSAGNVKGGITGPCASPRRQQ